MNDVTPQNKKRSFPFPLVVLGFISIIILLAWLSIKIVHLAPSAFSSLASLAETLNSRQEQARDETESTNTIFVSSNVTLANAGETITLSWSEASVPGTFTFSYVCHDGVAIDLIDLAGVRNIECDTQYNIGNTTNLDLSIKSQKSRYTDVAYTVAFLGTNDTTPRASGTAQITVLNTDVQNSLTTTIEEPAVETDITTTPAVETPTETPVTVPVPTPVEEYVYTVPVSDPNGRTDLGVVYLGTGTIVGNTFFPGLVQQSEAGAIQFAVKNYGTKTSSDWTFTVKLPDGTTYTSTNQLPLKPNERALLTIGFVASNVSQHTFVVSTSEPNDQTALNNAFRQMVTFY